MTTSRMNDIHPVDALKSLGIEMTPECEAAARRICDELVQPTAMLDRVFDVRAVYKALSPLALSRTSYTNVSDTLDALAHVMRADSASVEGEK